MRKSKILATLGPSSSSRDVIFQLIREGVDGIRLNFSHGDLKEKKELIRVVRDIEQEIGSPIPIIGDLQGPTVRLGEFKPLQLKRGTRFRVGLNEGVPVKSEEFFKLIERGDFVLFEGGRIVCKVIEINGESAILEALVEGELRPKKTVAIHGKEYDLPPLTLKDEKDLEFCIKMNVEAIALSFVKKGDDIVSLKERIEELGGNSWVIAKIETRSAVNRINEIVREADGILVARGDLGAYFNLEEIPSIQKLLIERAAEYGKPSIVATQLLDSMIENPMPTRAEVMDVYTAIRMGADALLLTGETAIGKYPIDAIRWLERIIRKAEESGAIARRHEPIDLFDRFAKGVVLMADSIDGKVVAYTKSGITARRISSFRPKNGLLAAAPSLEVARRISLLWGVYSAYLPYLADKEDPSRDIIDEFKRTGLLKVGDIVVMTRGIKAGATDAVRILEVS